MTLTESLMFKLAPLATPLFASAAFAAEQAPETPKGFDKLWYVLASSSFAAGLIFLFLAAVITAYVAKVIRDRCLKAFRHHPVTLELKDDTRRFGRLEVERTGMEFVYMPEIRQEIAPGLNEASYILYQAEYPKMFLLLRFLDQLASNEHDSRRRYGLRIFNRKFFWRVRRKIRNAFAALKDAFLEAMNMIIGRMKGGQGAGAQVIGAQQRYVSQIGGTAISYLGENSFDPLLEKQIGRRMIVEVLKSPTETWRFEGTFTEYSGDFILITDSSYATNWAVECPPDGSSTTGRGITLSRTGQTLKINNANPYVVTGSLLPAPQAKPAAAPAAPAAATAPACAPAATMPEVRVEPQSGAELSIASAEGRLVIRLASVRAADIIIPRTIGWVRSKAETA